MSDTKTSIFDSEEFNSSESNQNQSSGSNPPEQNSSSPEMVSTSLEPTPEVVVSQQPDQTLPEQNSSSTPSSDSEFNSAKNENELFFEKFNNTKKNHKKAELEKARKQINKKNKSLSFERRLEENRYVGTIYGIIAGIIALILSISITVFVLNFRFMNIISTDDYKDSLAWYGVALGISNYYTVLNKAVVIMSGIAFSLVPIPFFFLLSTWFMGLNQIFRSRNFMIFLFTCIGLSLLIVLITIPMFSVIYANHVNLPFNVKESWKK